MQWHAKHGVVVFFSDLVERERDTNGFSMWVMSYMETVETNIINL